MIEAQRLTVDQNPLCYRPGRPTLAEVPGGHIERRRAQHLDPVEIAGRKVYPLLIREQPTRSIIMAVAQEAIAPPATETAPFFIITHTQEAQIEHAKNQARHLVIHDGLIVAFWRRLVWGQQDTAVIQRPHQLVKAIKHDHIRVEEEHFVGAQLVENVFETQAFNGGTQLNHGVGKQPPRCDCCRQISRQNHGVEGLPCKLEARRQHIRQNEMELNLRCK